MIRFDIAEAYCVLEWDWNLGGILWQRPSNRRRNESTAMQLHRMGFKPSYGLSFDALSDEGKDIYVGCLVRWGLAPHVAPGDDLGNYIVGTYVPEYVSKHFPQLELK